MRSFIKILLLLIMCIHATAQETELNKLKDQLNQHKIQDTFRVNRLNELAANTALSAAEKEQLAAEAISISRKIKYTIGEGFALTNAGSALYLQGDTTKALLFLHQADSLAKRTNNQQLFAYVLMNIGFAKYLNGDTSAIDYLLKAEQVAAQTDNKYLLLRCQTSLAQVYQIDLSNYPKAMEYAFKANRLGEGLNSPEAITRAQNVIGAIYAVMGDNTNALIAYKKAAEENKKLGNKNLEAILQNNIGEVYRLTAKYPEAIIAYKKAMAYDTTIASIGTSESNLADVYVRMDSLPLAFYYGFRSLQVFKQLDDPSFEAWIYGILARAYLKQNKPDSAIYSAALGFNLAKETGTIEFMRDNTEVLSKAYAVKKNFEQAYIYQLQYITYRDSMVNEAIRNNAAIQQYNYNLEKKQSEITVLNQQKKIQHNFLLSSLIVLLFIFITAILLLRNNRHKQKANELLQVQKKELEVERDKTSKAMTELQQTQKQLIQSEKMASLGELTAGIAHEIQNPLNFVNNFSELNKEMLEELKAEHIKPKAERNEILESELINDVINNEQKINLHGKRADSIVKGMLQHSRASTGKKELTDINALVDESLRLSYHGMRAKNKEFNAAIKTDLDESIGKINIVPQDISRVLINLFNNAFYAITEKKKRLNGVFEPTIAVYTNKVHNKIEITIKDNGSGISQNIIDKIFQPFFTTKPTGQGTGLGLSLSYDIIKAHGGEIKVESEEGEGSAFFITLPGIIMS